MSDLISTLIKHKNEFAPVIPSEFLAQPPFIFDFTENNPELATLDLGDVQQFSQYIESTIQSAGRTMGAGGYGEDRLLYKKSSLFTTKTEEPRSVHLAVDLWLPAGTEIFSPLPAVVHSFQNNQHYLDYGPTIILKHTLDGITFYTLYGHLSPHSLDNLRPGQKITAGQNIAVLGTSAENGQWPPHLHFQIIRDMLGKKGDFFGVAKPSERTHYLELCPNPNLLLLLPGLS